MYNRSILNYMTYIKHMNIPQGIIEKETKAGLQYRSITFAKTTAQNTHVESKSIIRLAISIQNYTGPDQRGSLHYGKENEEFWRPPYTGPRQVTSSRRRDYSRRVTIFQPATLSLDPSLIILVSCLNILFKSVEKSPAAWDALKSTKFITISPLKN